MNIRKSELERITKETNIFVSLSLDEIAPPQIQTSVPFLTHMLEQLAFHGKIGLIVRAAGDTDIDDHHLVEDLGITLGQVLDKALGERIGLTRYGSQRLPMDETLIEADIDLSTRIYLHYDLPVGTARLGTFDPQLFKEFWRALATNARLNLHLSYIRGENVHHIVEASFKAFARALQKASRVQGTEISSTKGML